MRTFLLASCAAVALACNGGPATDPDCQNMDLGSCGVACCRLEFLFSAQTTAAQVNQGLLNALEKGGPDGRFALTTTADGTFGTEKFPQPEVYPYNYLGQAYHTSPMPDGTLVTSGPYRDTLNFLIYQNASQGANRTMLRAFSISEINGALGDHGMNYKGLLLVARKMLANDASLEWSLSHPDSSCHGK